MPGAILVFAKAPRPGLVKTRMCPPLSLEQAAQLYAHLLDDVLAATAELARPLELETVLTVYPADACRELAERCPASFRVVPQRGRSLGERMAWATSEAAASGADPIVLRGSDSPVLDGDRVAALLEHLVRADVAICPDLDGGYSLIGMRRPIAGLFDHAMSASSVLSDTLAGVSEQGLRASAIPGSFDLDTVDDLALLAASRSQGDAVLCPRLVEYLDEQDLWGEAARAVSQASIEGA